MWTRGARVLLTLLLPRHDRDAVLGDLDEECRLIARDAGPRTAQVPSGNFSVVIRADAPFGVEAAARRAVANIDPELPVFAVRTMEEIATQ